MPKSQAHASRCEALEPRGKFYQVLKVSSNSSNKKNNNKNCNCNDNNAAHVKMSQLDDGHADEVAMQTQNTTLQLQVIPIYVAYEELRYGTGCLNGDRDASHQIATQVYLGVVVLVNNTSSDISHHNHHNTLSTSTPTTSVEDSHSFMPLLTT